MRPFKPAPKNAAANRIRERYLHQLGLQRGAGGGPPATTSPHGPGSVVVISGLPPLPEDRATTPAGHVLASHDFSHRPDPGSADAGSGPAEDGSAASPAPGGRGGAPPACDRALAYPAALRKLPPPVARPCPPPTDRNLFPFSLWSKSESSPALLEHGGNDYDSVSSAGTCTTAESSLTANGAMMTRDWGAVPHLTRCASQDGGENQGPCTPVGVYFQCGHDRLTGSAPSATLIASNANCASTSSLAHEMLRFNIDSDCDVSMYCEASVTSNCEDSHAPTHEEDDGLSLDDTASLSSHASAGGGRRRRGPRPKKKIGRTQRLMDRAAAHERILQRSSDMSHKRRAERVHSHRGRDPPVAAAASGLALAMTAAHDDGDAPLPSEVPGAVATSRQVPSIPLMHVQHGANGGGCATARKHVSLSPLKSHDLGRTPTASNCTDPRRLKDLLQDQLIGEASVPDGCLSSLPSGVHVSPSLAMQQAQEHSPVGRTVESLQRRRHAAKPLGFRPQLASCVPPPPPKLAGVGTLSPQCSPPSSLKTSHVDSRPHSEAAGVEHLESREADESTCHLHHLNHQATVDDVMEVAMTLSKLGERTPYSVPRIR